MNQIIWTEQNELFGLDYSSKKGKFHDYEFDIRYDYDGDPKIKPENCRLFLIIFKANTRIGSAFGISIKALTTNAEMYLERERQKFLK
jgi:hypothetical protein